MQRLLYSTWCCRWESLPHEDALCRDCNDATHWIIDNNEGMKEAAHLFLILLLHATGSMEEEEMVANVNTHIQITIQHQSWWFI